ncbi:MAG: Tn7 transposase TnsA N-terminal domain-containing protein [Chryseotalea sp.]|jgi:hypothetical protein|nr:TnsA endonuclease N-terminal domain-containing protein [Cyclobacteriaceae bacterium]
MGKRKIGKSPVKYTGKKSTSKNDELIEFESLIEKDFLELVDYDDEVKKVTSQPLTIKVDPKYELDKKTYTPDFLVEFNPELKKKNQLIEIKPEIRVKKNQEFFNKLSEVVNDYCKPFNQEFLIVTENTIRNDFLTNISKLNYYKSQGYNQILANQIIQVLKSRSVSILELLNILKSTNHEQEITHSIWCMLSLKKIGCNLKEKINLKTILFLNESK